MPLTFNSGIAYPVMVAVWPDTAALAEKVPSGSATCPVRKPLDPVVVLYAIPNAGEDTAAELFALVMMRPAAAVMPTAADAPKSAVLRFIEFFLSVLRIRISSIRGRADNAGGSHVSEWVLPDVGVRPVAMTWREYEPCGRWPGTC